MTLSTIAIVGASLAGLNAAQTLRSSGFDGRITVVDADHNTPYDKPPLSKEMLKGDWDRERIVLPGAKADLDLDLRLGTRAERLDLGARQLHVAAGPQASDGGDGPSVIDFDGLVIATGAAARTLPNPDDLAGIHVLRSLDDCLAIAADLDAGPRRVVVIGAGFIGAEVAASCRSRNLDVTIIEALDVPLERALGRQMGEVSAAIHRDHDVDLRLGAGVAGFVGSPGGRVEGVQLADGTVVDADVVVVGIGVVPNVGWLEGAGLTIGDGVLVDETLLAAPGVVAAGDLARYPSTLFGQELRIEHWETAIQMGEAAARRLLVADGEQPAAFDPVPWFWSDQYDRKIQLAGRAAADDHVEVVIGSVDERRFVAMYERDGRVVAVLGINRPRHVMQLRGLVAERASWDAALARAAELA